MNRRAIQHLLVNVLLVAGSVFYLLAPMVFAFFSEVSMSYGAGVPKWFAATAPARISARIFDRYNADAPRAARFDAHLTCFLADDGATQTPGCGHEIRAGQFAAGPEQLKMASGRYIAVVAFAGSDRCSGGEAELQVVTTGRFGTVRAESSVRISAGERIELPFELPMMDAALAPVQFRVIGVSGCVLLDRLQWTPASR